MADQVIRPRLSLADTRLLLDALDHIRTKKVEEVRAVSDLGARLQTSAQNGKFQGRWFRLMNG